jgi:uncharacterized membrane protein SpoIIM required for sporulation
VKDGLNEFIRRHRPTWNQAERLLDRIEQEGLETLPEKEVLEFGEIYRELSDNLVRARSEFSNPETVEYLNSLVGRGYAVIYRGRRHRFKAMLRFLRSGFPRLCRSRKPELMFAIAAFAAGLAFGGVAGLADPESVQYLVEKQYASVSPTRYLQSKGSLEGPGEAALMMGMISTNNIRVAILAFAMGMTLGVGTLAILFYNGVMLAAFSSIFVRAGSGFELFGVLAPHGLIEMTAMIIAGAAGLILGRAMLAPGARTRTLALREDGPKALLMLAGSIPIFLAAMVIESTLSKFQSVGPGAKSVCGFLALAVVLAWILLGGKRPESIRESAAP